MEVSCGCISSLIDSAERADSEVALDFPLGLTAFRLGVNFAHFRPEFV